MGSEKSVYKEVLCQLETEQEDLEEEVIAIHKQKQTEQEEAAEQEGGEVELLVEEKRNRRFV